MIIKPDAITSSSPTSTCGRCGVEELRLLHNVRHRDTFRRLCTSCVLRLHPESFCPVCFAVYNPAAPMTSGIKCSRCYSYSHPECVVADRANSYVCSLCLDPNSPIFMPKKVKNLIVENPAAAAGMINDGASGEYRVIDEWNAKVLLAAAEISADSMSKAAMAARATAEQRAMEAASTRKRARAALERVALLVAKKENSKSNSGVGARVGNGSSNGAVGRSNPAPVMRGDSSGDILAALNAVELKDVRFVRGEPNPANVGLARPLNDAVPMDIEENRRPEMSAVVKVEKL
ncbi:OLC1v1038692C1 [Oldenlandia corymbosa var. corymbosa]|uniref:OLC1v1038692C1 n=1 Tax=Oldenlandia corymbosa var. corymbosa TaxID=529605 RepID=A0AAV1D447_OLDCO|nr:OLC1v1038692C1 [Oldenlandia corymbosa var. corymbosa]